MMRDRASPPNYEAYDPDPCADEPERERFAFTDLWWSAALAAFMGFSVDTLRLGLSPGWLLLDAGMSAIVGLCAAGAIRAALRLRGV
jgi:hypothetical protein